MRILSAALALTMVLGTAVALKHAGPLAPAGKHIGRVVPVVHGASHTPRHPLDDVYSNRDTLRIPDFPGDTAVSHITINDTTTINDLNIYVDVHHPWVRDLYITVSGPGDTARVVLLNLLPRDSAVNLIGWFDDGAALSIMDTLAPLVGEWRPLQPLSRFYGRRAQGTWTLRVYDRFRVDSGYVAMWSVEVNRRFILTGIVRNAESRALLSGVRVELLSTDFVTYSLSSGAYGLSGVPSGVYTMRFSKVNFETLLVPDVSLDSSTTTTLDTALQVNGGFHEFASTSSSIRIPDGDVEGATMSLTIPTSAIIGDIDILVNIRHPYVSDLSLFLTSPANHRIVLATAEDSSLDNYTNCRFDDAASLAIWQGQPPFTGRFRPEDSLARFNGENMQGLWQFTAVDSFPADSGEILNFTLYITERQAAANPRMNVAADFSFPGNYPNPFNARTTFRFSVPANMNVRLTLFNLAGQEVARIFDDHVTAGDHEVPFDAGRLPSGVYFARLQTARHTAVHKVLLLR
jgi:subtilisin-like proprotein convertase family protein